MTTKRAWDIPPSAVVCLSLGLLIGRVVMPDYNVIQYDLREPPTMDVTIVDVDEGRLLERSPESWKSQMTPSPEIQGEGPDSAKQASSKELADLAKLASSSVGQGAASATDLDTPLIVALGFFAILAVAVMRVDFDEMTAELQNASKSDVITSSARAPRIEEGPLVHVRWLGRFILLVVVGMLVTIVSFWLTEWCPSCRELAGSSEHANTMELQSLVQDASLSTGAIIADHALMLGLGAFVAVGAAVMRVDNHEMGQELQSGSEVTAPPAVNATPVKTATHTQPFWRQHFFRLLCVAVVLAATASALFMAWPTGFSGEVEHAGAKELRALIGFNSSSALLSEYLVVFVLAAFVALGAAVMRVDFHEIRDELESEMRAPSPSTVSIPTIGESVADAVSWSMQPTPSSPCWHLQHGPPRQCVLKYLAIAAVCVVLASFAGALSPTNQEELGGSAEHARNMELQSLVQDASSSTKAITADHVVMLGLGAFVAIGAAVMRTDNHEMGQELQSGSGVMHPPTVNASPMKMAAHAHPSWQQCFFGLLCVSVVLAATVSATFMAWSTSLSEEVEHAGAKELRALVEINYSSYLFPDYLVVFVLGASVALGAAVMRVDFHEISDELESEMRAPSPSTVSIPTIGESVADAVSWSMQPSPKPPCCRLHYGLPSRRCVLKYLTVAAVCVVLASFVGVLSSANQEELAGSAEHASTMELQLLVQDASSSTKATIADHIVMLGLGAFIAIGAAVMRVDNHAMGQELQSVSEVTVVAAPPMKMAANAHPSWRQWSFGLLCATVVLAATASAMFMAWSTSLSEEVEHAGAKELRALVEFNSTSTLLPDYLVVFVLGAFVVLGGAAMRVDFHEIRDELESEMRAPFQPTVNMSPIGERMADAVHWSMQPSPPLPCCYLQHVLPSRRCVLKYLAIATVFAFLASFAKTLSSANPGEVAGPAKHASIHCIQELQSLVQDSSSLTKAPVADSLVMLGLGVFVVIGAAVMRVDNHEMAETLQSGSEVAVPPAAAAPPTAAAAHAHSSWRQCFLALLWVSGVLAATASAVFMAWPTRFSGEVEHAGAKELRALVEFKASSAVFPDYLVVFVLGAFGALGAAVMRSDFDEMTEQLHNDSAALAGACHQKKVK